MYTFENPPTHSYFQPLLNYIILSSKFLGFRMGVVEVAVLLGWRAMSLGERCSKF